jgi:hypothetical protein
LKKSLPEPFGNDLSVLDDADNIGVQGKSVMWKGEDASYLRINLFTTAQQGDKMRYTVQIKSESPAPERKGLQ